MQMPHTWPQRYACGVRRVEVLAGQLARVRDAETELELRVHARHEVKPERSDLVVAVRLDGDGTLGEPVEAAAGAAASSSRTPGSRTAARSPARRARDRSGCARRARHPRDRSTARLHPRTMAPRGAARAARAAAASRTDRSRSPCPRRRAGSRRCQTTSADSPAGSGEAPVHASCRAVSRSLVCWRRAVARYARPEAT